MNRNMIPAHSQRGSLSHPTLTLPLARSPCIICVMPGSPRLFAVLLFTGKCKLRTLPLSCDLAPRTAKGWRQATGMGTRLQHMHAVRHAAPAAQRWSQSGHFLSIIYVHCLFVLSSVFCSPFVRGSDHRKGAIFPH